MAGGRMSGRLYLVATPIGNNEDITLRALRVLKEADLVVCEERREGERLLRHWGITKPLETLNEHNEAAATHVLMTGLKAGRVLALVSDGGTPVFSDPGAELVRRASEAGIPVTPVPGASSLMPALTVSGFGIDRFLFYGWLSPKKERRQAELRQLVSERRTIVLMDTPYRLTALLRDLASAFGERRRMCLAYNLTMPDEQIFHGTPKGLSERIAAGSLKGEFVIVIEGLSHRGE
jgi:16S rRNA (cytidine1402-2'-O)-methyltransferase